MTKDKIKDQYKEAKMNANHKPTNSPSDDRKINVIDDP